MTKEITVRGVTLSLTQWAAVCGWSSVGLADRISARAEHGEPASQVIESLLPTSPPKGPRPRAITVGPISATLDEWAEALDVPRWALENAGARRTDAETIQERLQREIESRIRERRPVHGNTVTRSRVLARRAAGELPAAIALAEGVSESWVSETIASHERAARIAALADEGHTTYEIAKIVGVSTGRVDRVLAGRGRAERISERKRERNARIAERRARGETMAAIAASEGISKGAVSRILKESKP